MIEEAENLRTLVVENKEIRQELDKLKADHEKSIAQVLESSSMATEERDRKIAAQDKVISDLKNEIGREKDISQALRTELQSLWEENTKIDDVIFGTFHLSDLSFLRLLSMSVFPYLHFVYRSSELDGLLLVRAPHSPAYPSR